MHRPSHSEYVESPGGGISPAGLSAEPLAMGEEVNGWPDERDPPEREVSLEAELAFVGSPANDTETSIPLLEGFKPVLPRFD